MKQTEVRQQLDHFIERISARIEKGQEEYGNRSFEQPLDVLSNEVLEELEWVIAMIMTKCVRAGDESNSR